MCFRLYMFIIPYFSSFNQIYYRKKNIGTKDRFYVIQVIAMAFIVKYNNGNTYFQLIFDK